MTNSMEIYNFATNSSRNTFPIKIFFNKVVATFTADELMPFNSFVFYTVLTAMVAQDRQTLRKKVIDSPEIFAVIKEIPHLSEFLNSYYNGKYDVFMRRFVDILDAVKMDPYMDKHVRYFARAMRLNAYRQFLQSYESVTLEAMGVDENFDEQKFRLLQSQQNRNEIQYVRFKINQL